MSLLASSAAGSKWIRLSSVIPEGSTQIVYNTPMANLKGQKVLFSIFNEEQQLFRTQEILISRKSEDIGYSVYNKLGDHISFLINVFVTGADSRFVVENNEAFDLSFVLYRLDIF